MGMKPSKEGRKKRKKESEITLSFENKANTSPPLTSQNNSDIEWELKLARNKIETLNSELEDCKQKIQVLEEDKKIASEKLEKYKEYKFLSEFYFKQIEEYKNAADKHDDMYTNLRNKYDEKIEHYQNQLEKYKSSFASQKKYENPIRSQQIAHRLDLLDLEKRLLESKVKVLNNRSHYNLDKEIEKDKKRLQEIYDEAFMSQKYVTNVYYSDEESSGHPMIENESNRKSRSKDYNAAKCIELYNKDGSHFKRRSESTQSLSNSTRESIRAITESTMHSSSSRRQSHPIAAKGFSTITETWDTEYETDEWNLYISSFASLNEVLMNFIDFSQEIKRRVSGIKSKLHLILNSYKNCNQEYMRDVILDFFKVFSRKIGFTQLFKSPVDLFNSVFDELNFEISPSTLFCFEVSQGTSCAKCSYLVKEVKKWYPYFYLSKLPFISIQTFINSLSDLHTTKEIEYCAECDENQNMNCNIDFLTLPKYLVFENDDDSKLNNKNKYNKNKIERTIMVNEEEYVLHAFIFKSKEDLYKAKIFDVEISDEDLSLKRDSRYSSALMVFYMKRYI